MASSASTSSTRSPRGCSDCEMDRVAAAGGVAATSSGIALTRSTRAPPVESSASSARRVSVLVEKGFHRMSVPPTAPSCSESMRPVMSRVAMPGTRARALRISCAPPTPGSPMSEMISRTVAPSAVSSRTASSSLRASTMTNPTSASARAHARRNVTSSSTRRQHAPLASVRAPGVGATPGDATMPSASGRSTAKRVPSPSLLRTVMAPPT